MVWKTVLLALWLNNSFCSVCGLLASLLNIELGLTSKWRIVLGRWDVRVLTARSMRLVR